MSTKGKANNAWFYMGISGILISLISLLMPIIRYDDLSLNIFDFLTGNWKFKYLADGYIGKITVHIFEPQAAMLSILAIIALMCAIIGLISLRAQRPNTLQFILTVIGLIGISIPSFVAIYIVIVHAGDYLESISIGIAPIISPIAILLSIAAVIRRKNKVAEEIRREVESRGLIRRGGDL